MITEEQIKPFAELLEREQLKGLVNRQSGCLANRLYAETAIRIGKKFAKVDLNGGGCGRYMVDLETGEIFGIKAYGVIHRGHRFGTLETIDQWDWSDYLGVIKQMEAA